ncbi:MAG: hypothetical protein EBV06_14360 [Planctomycetia bacterium]|nr:hypothetical protein [Planctomycetia bacterium]
MNPSLVIISLFLIALALVYGFMRVLFDRPLKTDSEGPEPPDVFAPDLAAMLPALPETRRELQRLLWTAGRYRPSSLTEYLAVRAILVIGAVIATVLLVVTAPIEQLPIVLGFGAALAFLGFSMPRVILSSLASARANRIKGALPMAMDVIGLCLTAGQNLLASLKRSAEEIRDTSPDMALELQIIHQQARMHSLETALIQWADRLDIPEVRSLALLLVQSDRLGTDMVNTLLEVAESQRVLQRQRAETQANRANFWMLFPTLFCLWTSTALILIGPVYLEFWQYRREQMKSLLGNASGQVKRSNNPTTPPASGDKN